MFTLIDYIRKVSKNSTFKASINTSTYIQICSYTICMNTQGKENSNVHGCEFSFSCQQFLRVHWNFQIDWRHFTQFYLSLLLCHFFFMICGFYWLKCSNVYSLIHFKGTDHYMNFLFWKNSVRTCKYFCLSFLFIYPSLPVSSLHNPSLLLSPYSSPRLFPLSAIRNFFNIWSLKRIPL